MTNLRLVSNNHHDDEHSENSDPSGEIIFNAPLPPYERQWRHPSEVAEQVQLFTPEPRLPSRTVRSIATYAAATSFVVSLVLLWVVTPRSYTSVPAVAKRTVLVDSSTGVAWMHSVDSSTHRFINLAQNLTPPSTALSEMSQGQHLYIASPSEGISDARIAITSAHSTQRNLWPIDYFMHDHCRGAALNSLQQLIGWCVELNGAHWVVPTRQLVDVLHRLESNVGQP